MARVVALPVLSSVPNGDGEDDSLATRLLREQADLRAVERFSQLHDAGEEDLDALPTRMRALHAERDGRAERCALGGEAAKALFRELAAQVRGIAEAERTLVERIADAR